MQTQDNLIVRLDKVAGQVSYLDRSLADHFRSLGQALSTPGYDARWADLDLFRIMGPTVVRERLEAREESRRGRVINVLEVIRSTLIFLPLVITWYGIAVASSSYQQLVATRPSAAQEPFLTLWLNGFDQLTSITLGWVAALDFAILLVVFLLSVIITVLMALQTSNRQQLYDAISAVLLDASLELSRSRGQGPITAATDFNKTLNHISTEFTRLVNDMSQVSTNRRAELDAFTKLAPTFQNMVDGLNQVNTQLVQQLGSLSATLGTYQQDTQKVLAGIQQLQGQFNQLITQQAQFASALSILPVAVDRLVQASHIPQAVATKLNSALHDMQRGIGTIQTESQQIVNQQQLVVQSLDAMNREQQQLADIFTQQRNQLAVLPDVQREVAALCLSLQNVSRLLEQSSTKLQEVVKRFI